MRESRYWFMFVLAGVCMIFVLGAHMVLMHLETALTYVGVHLGGEPLEWASVMGRAKSAGWLVTYLVLLPLGLYHGLYGLRSILLEAIDAKNSRTVTGILVTLGIAAFAIGAYVVIRSYMMGGV